MDEAERLTCRRIVAGPLAAGQVDDTKPPATLPTEDSTFVGGVQVEPSLEHLPLVIA